LGGIGGALEIMTTAPSISVNVVTMGWFDKLLTVVDWRVIEGGLRIVRQLA
jgi:hypothetical protein